MGCARGRAKTCLRGKIGDRPAQKWASVARSRLSDLASRHIRLHNRQYATGQTPKSMQTFPRFPRRGAQRVVHRGAESRIRIGNLSPEGRFCVRDVLEAPVPVSARPPTYAAPRPRQATAPGRRASSRRGRVFEPGCQGRWCVCPEVMRYSTSILWTQPSLSSMAPDWMPVSVSRSFCMTGPTWSMP